MTLSVVPGGEPASFAATVELPKGTDASTFNAMLNGLDVTSRFAAVPCGTGVCLGATVSAADGMRNGKNVLSALARNAQGNPSSARVRFAGAASSPTSPVTGKARALSVSATRASGMAKASSVIQGVSNPFLPPTVSLNTLNAGGWTIYNPWFTVGTLAYPQSTPSNCASSLYAVVVFDRQTLEQKTAEPESSPRCMANSSDLRAYLATLPSTDLVIAGTLYGQNADAGLDTTPIGGTLWKGSHGQRYYPSGYMVIGAGGQSGGAYESYYDSYGTDSFIPPFATGTLQEDAYGNYNFQSSDVVEYAISPNDPAYLTPNTTSAISIAIPASQQVGPLVRTVYTPPTSSNSQGYWLLLLNRVTLQPTVPCTGVRTISADGATAFAGGCGQFFDGATSANVDGSYTALASALNGVNPWQLVMLTTVKQAGGANKAATLQSATSLTGFKAFRDALTTLGGTAYLAAADNPSANDAYSFVGFPGASNPLTGNAVESSTVLAAQGQTGLVHGTLQRNNNGLFTPLQTSQESQGLFAAKGGLTSSDFKLSVASYQQPVDWPSASTVTLLPGASSLDGQVAAYRYISHILLAGHYIKGLQDSHADDIHYFFTGSSNTFIDYHTFDPVALTFPGGNNGTDTAQQVWDKFQCWDSFANACGILPPGDAAVSAFTPADFNAVQQQVSLEIQYLDNVVQFMITGSTNMKSVIAGGNSNVGLALTGAAASILASKLTPAPPSQQVSFSWQNVLSMVGGILSIAATFEGLGELSTAFTSLSAATQKAIKGATGTANAVGGLLSITSSAGQIRSETSSHTLPTAFGTFATTIGQLASTNLQDQLSSGFDVATDNITSDWGRLSMIGPRIVNTDDPVFYSPNQVSQNIAVSALTQASSRSFYMALLPSFYYVHFWPGVNSGTSVPPIPDMGYMSGTLKTTCTAFYLNPNTTDLGLGSLPIYSNMWYPTVGSGSQPFSSNQSALQPIDWFILAGKSANSGTSATFIPTINEALAATMFSPAQLGIPIQQFVAPNGPMKSVWVDASVTSPAGHQNTSICDAHEFPQGDVGTQNGSGDPGKDRNGLDITTTTLSGAVGVLGNSATLTAKVAAGSAPVLVGSVYFLVDGIIVGNAAVGAGGVATLTLADPALGRHSIQAEYSRDGQYAPSTSISQTVSVYSESPDLSLLSSTKALDVSYDKASSPIDLKVSSVAGMTGNVTFSCSGLPAGMSCSFTPAQVMLAPDGSSSTSFVVGASGASTVAAGLGLLCLPVSLFGFRRKRSEGFGSRMVPCAVLLCTILAGVSGCGGGNGDSSRETGVKTILVTATAGLVSRSVPIDVTIR